MSLRRLHPRRPLPITHSRKRRPCPEASFVRSRVPLRSVPYDTRWWGGRPGRGHARTAARTATEDVLWHTLPRRLHSRPVCEDAAVRVDEERARASRSCSVLALTRARILIPPAGVPAELRLAPHIPRRQAATAAYSRRSGSQRALRGRHVAPPTRRPFFMPRCCARWLSLFATKCRAVR